MTNSTEKFQAFAITFRPKDGCHEDDDHKVMSFITKFCDQWKVVEEMDGDARHIHAGVVTKKPFSVSEFNQKAKRFHDEFRLPAWKGTRWFKDPADPR